MHARGEGIPVAVTAGNPALPAAVIAHGSGSDADFIVRAFAAPLAAAGLRLVTWDRAGAPPGAGLAQLAALAEAHRARVLGGVSLGAVLAVRRAATLPAAALDGLLLVLPAWSGPPGAVAALSAAAAEEVARDGLAAALDRARRHAVPWVAEEIGRAWPAYGEATLLAELRATATTPGPSHQELAACTVPAAVVALAGDPFHPEEVAAEWAARLPRAAAEVVPLDAPARDRAELGAAAVRAWTRAAALSAPR